MYLPIFRITAVIAFFVIQLFAAGIFFVIRYHFRAFGTPGDRHVPLIVWIFGFGLLSFAVFGGWALANLFPFQ